MKLEDIQAFAATLPKREIKAEGGKVYLERYLVYGWSPATPDLVSGGSVYLHHIILPDQDERHVLHNHPWRWAMSFVLNGWYVEERARTSGAHYCRTIGHSIPNALEADTFHRITDVSPDCWTLFMVGPKQQGWGFDVPEKGFVPWRARLAERGITPDY
jgi:hypothetical protein